MTQTSWPKWQLSHLAHITWNIDQIKRCKVRVIPDLLPPPITGYYCQDSWVRRALGVNSGKQQSQVNSWHGFLKSFRSYLSEKEDTAATKHTRGPILKIFHSPKPGVPTLWQEVGPEHTKRPKENRIQFCSFGCPACNHKSIHKNMELGHMAEVGHRGLLWQESDWMVKDSLGKTNGLEAIMNNEGTTVFPRK